VTCSNKLASAASVNRPSAVAPREDRAAPDFLTDDQLDAFDFYQPTATPEAVSGFLAVCQLEGVGVPTRESMLAEIELRSGG
jgi:hypothetical protein